MSSKGLLQKPKHFQNGLSIYCPKQIIEHFDFNDEVKKLNKSGRISRKLNVDTLKINFILLVNFLSNKIPTNESKDFKYIQSTDLRKYGSDKYYRVCIDMLKRSGFLYIKSYKQKETYSAGVIAKGYRWNKSSDQFKRMHVMYEHKVHEHKTKKKIIDNIEKIQCFKYSKPFMTKLTRKISKYKRPYKFGSGKNGKYFWRDVAFVNQWYEKCIYISNKTANYLDSKKKYALQNYLYGAYGLVLRLKMYKNMSFKDIKELISSIESRIYDYTGDFMLTGIDFRKFYEKGHKIHNMFVTCDRPSRLFQY